MVEPITVEPGQLTINDGATFLVIERDGRIRPEMPQGLFAHETRFISGYQFRLNNADLVMLAAGPTSYKTSLSFFTNPVIQTPTGTIRAHTILVMLTRHIAGGLHEDWIIQNNGDMPVQLQLSLRIESDFADIFSIRSGQVMTIGWAETYWYMRAAYLETNCRRSTFRATLRYQLVRSSTPPRFKDGAVVFDVDLAPQEAWHTCIAISIGYADRLEAPPHACYLPGQEAPEPSAEARWAASITRLEAADGRLTAAFRQAVADLGALRLTLAGGSRDDSR